MKRSTKWFLGAAIAVGTFGAGTGAVLASGGADEAEDGAETPITGTELDQASAAALDHLGEGRVSDTEVGDEEGYYEVEVTLDDGSEVGVHLDADSPSSEPKPKGLMRSPAPTIESGHDGRSGLRSPSSRTVPVVV